MVRAQQIANYSCSYNTLSLTRDLKNKSIPRERELSLVSRLIASVRGVNGGRNSSQSSKLTRMAVMRGNSLSLKIFYEEKKIFAKKREDCWCVEHPAGPGRASPDGTVCRIAFLSAYFPPMAYYRGDRARALNAGRWPSIHQNYFKAQWLCRLNRAWYIAWYTRHNTLHIIHRAWYSVHDTRCMIHCMSIEAGKKAVEIFK